MPHYPMQQSWPIQNLVASLNSLLGGQYFTITYSPPDTSHSIGWYYLNPTEQCLKDKKFLHIHTEGGMIFSDMYQYLSGILIGFEAAKEKFGIK
jgi:hypothetical protein